VTKNTVVFTFVLFAATTQAQTFKVGDYVDISFAGGWIPCTVSKPVSGNTVGVSCGANESRVQASAQYIRARAATAEDKSVEAETAAALARQPKGNSLGAQYGTREPVTCASRTAPARGAPSADQVRQYFICDEERETSRFTLALITNVKVQVGAASHPPNPQVTQASDIDLSQPVWDIRGSFTNYSCNKLTSLLGWPTNVNDFARTHNCNVTDESAATGSCYKNTFGDWHCTMVDVAALIGKTRANVLPPGN
jgi:hypothetical protein